MPTSDDPAAAERSPKAMVVVLAVIVVSLVVLILVALSNALDKRVAMAAQLVISAAVVLWAMITAVLNEDHRLLAFFCLVLAATGVYLCVMRLDKLSEYSDAKKAAEKDGTPLNLKEPSLTLVPAFLAAIAGLILRSLRDDFPAPSYSAFDIVKMAEADSLPQGLTAAEQAFVKDAAESIIVLTNAMGQEAESGTAGKKANEVLTAYMMSPSRSKERKVRGALEAWSIQIQGGGSKRSDEDSPRQGVSLGTGASSKGPGYTGSMVIMYAQKHLLHDAQSTDDAQSQSKAGASSAAKELAPKGDSKEAGLASAITGEPGTTKTSLENEAYAEMEKAFQAIDSVNKKAAQQAVDKIRELSEKANKSFVINPKTTEEGRANMVAYVVSALFWASAAALNTIEAGIDDQIKRLVDDAKLVATEAMITLLKVTPETPQDQFNKAYGTTEEAYVTNRQVARYVELKNGIALYRNDFFENEDLKNAVVKYYTEKGAPESFVVVGNSTDEDIIKNTLLHRVPVYYGQPMRDLYDSSALPEVLGVDPGTILPAKNPVRLAIAGLVPVFDDKNNYTEKGLMGAIHTYGLNFESKQTSDYKRLVNGDGMLKEEEVTENAKEMYRMIYAAAAKLAEKANVPKAKIRIPLIGLGAYLEALNNDQRQAVATKYAEAFIDVHSHAPEYHSRVSETHFYVKYSSVPSFKEAQQTFVDKVSTAKLADVRIIDGSMFKQGEGISTSGKYILDGEDLLVLVNAWDTGSFIGNGGKEDLSVDGFFVSGNNNPDFKNGSFLQNPWLSRQLLEPKDWERLNTDSAEAEAEAEQAVDAARAEAARAEAAAEAEQAAAEAEQAAEQAAAAAADAKTLLKEATDAAMAAAKNKDLGKRFTASRDARRAAEFKIKVINAAATAKSMAGNATKAVTRAVKAKEVVSGAGVTRVDEARVYAANAAVTRATAAAEEAVEDEKAAAAAAAAAPSSS